jgi:hypothetical protein
VLRRIVERSPRAGHLWREIARRLHELVDDIRGRLMDVTHFRFEGISLREVCWLEGKPYFTRRAIAEWLEYSGDQPQKAVDKIIERNPHIGEFSTTVNLTVVEGGRELTRTLEVYDPIGLQLIAFESHQPKALQFKVAVAHLIYAFMSGKLKPSKWTLKGDLVSAARQILSLPTGHRRGELMRDLAEQEGVTVATAYRRVHLATGQRLRDKVRSSSGTTKYPGEKERALVYAKDHLEATAAEIRASLGLNAAASTITRWRRESCTSMRRKVTEAR